MHAHVLSFSLPVARGGLVLALALLLGQIAHAQAPICGDCNLNGVGPDILDALVAAQIAAGVVTPVALQSLVCDIDSSTLVNIIDALIIAQAAAGLAVTLNCPPLGPPAPEMLYVNVGNAVELVDLATNTSVGTVPLGGTTGNGMAIDDAGDFVYASVGSSLVEIDTTTNMVSRTLALNGTAARQVTLAGGHAYVVHYATPGNSSLDRVDLLTQVVATISIGPGAWGLGRNRTGTQIYTAHIAGGDIVTRVPTATFMPIAPRSLPENPIAVEGDPNSGNIYVGCRDTNPDLSGLMDLHELDPLTLMTVRSFAVDDAWGLAVMPDSSALYAGSNHQTGAPAPPYLLHKVDLLTGTVTTPATLGNQPWYFALDAAGTALFTCDNASMQVTRIDTATDTVAATVPLTAPPRDAVVR